MAYASLQDFIALLEQRGELHRVPVEVDPDLEVAAVTRRVHGRAGGGKALFFPRVKGSAFPLVTNLFGTADRAALALGAPSLEQLRQKMERLMAAGEGDPSEILLEQLGSFTPTCTGGDPWDLAQPDLTALPFIRGASGDGGSYLTLPMVFTRDPESGRQNCGMYRVQRLDATCLAISWRPGSGGEGHAAPGAPVAVCLGGDPALMFAAAFSFPADADEMAFAGMLRGEPVPMVPCRTGGLLVPADAEMVIEGVLEGGAAQEGPFANHTGFYSAGRLAARMRVTCIRRRGSPVIPATVLGRPPVEDSWMAKAWERLLLPYLQVRYPELTELNMPLESIFHRACLLALRRGSDARSLLERLRGEPELSGARLLVAVDEEIDVHDPAAVYWRAVNAARLPADLTLSGGCATLNATVRQGIPVGEDAPIDRLVESRWGSYGF
ncbi:MAG TPA: UbiD family decarboxylase [Verrucomicrobiae bacterium]|nr:UbiD family decarboxylase [Verrucomicrobiae bacterium]